MKKSVPDHQNYFFSKIALLKLDNYAETGQARILL